MPPSSSTNQLALRGDAIISRPLEPLKPHFLSLNRPDEPSNLSLSFEVNPSASLFFFSSLRAISIWTKPDPFLATEHRECKLIIVGSGAHTKYHRRANLISGEFHPFRGASARVLGYEIHFPSTNFVNVSQEPQEFGFFLTSAENITFFPISSLVRHYPIPSSLSISVTHLSFLDFYFLSSQLKSSCRQQPHHHHHQAPTVLLRSSSSLQ